MKIWAAVIAWLTVLAIGRALPGAPWHTEAPPVHPSAGHSRPAWQPSLQSPRPSERAERLLTEALAADPRVSQQDQPRLGQRARWFLDAGQQYVARGSEETRARRAFEFLQRHLQAGQYDPGCGRLQQTLEQGTYNCLTASLLYLALCRDAGLSAVAIAAPRHVAVQVTLDGLPCAIETTDPHWRPRRADTGTASYRPISDQSLIARVHYNLGIELAQHGEYALALRATRQSYALDPKYEDARANLLATLTNWSVELTSRGEYDLAARLIHEGMALDATYAPLLRSEVFLRHRQESAVSPAPPWPTTSSDR